MTHTPTPWRVEKNRAPNGGSYYRIYDKNEAGNVIAQVIGDGRIEYHENATFIVRACNAHEELVAALKDLVAASNAVHRARMPGVRECPPDYAQLYESIHRAQAVLAKAEGN